MLDLVLWQLSGMGSRVCGALLSQCLHMQHLSSQHAEATATQDRHRHWLCKVRIAGWWAIGGRCSRHWEGLVSARACGGHGKKPHQGDPDVNAFLVALRLGFKSKVLAGVASLKATFLGLHVTASHCVLSRSFLCV